MPLALGWDPALLPLASSPASILQHFPPGTRHKGCLSPPAAPVACQAPPVHAREHGRGTRGCARSCVAQPAVPEGEHGSLVLGCARVSAAHAGSHVCVRTEGACKHPGVGTRVCREA